jgi:4-hydroxybenzoate polyprenyltransferase
MKRITYWPQLFLGITFNWGIIMAYASINNNVTQEVIVLYLSAIFWTLGYDTIYGAQDMSDDEIIGLKSTSIKFKKNPYIFLFSCYSIFFTSLLAVGYMMQLNKYYYLFLVFISLQLFFFQLKKLKIKDASNCLNIFRSNNFLGLIIFIGIIVGKI